LKVAEEAVSLKEESLKKKEEEIIDRQKELNAAGTPSFSPEVS